MFGPTVWRFGRVVDPFSDLLRLRDNINRVFSGEAYPFQPAYPAVNIWVNEKGAIVTAELPGLDTDKVDISVLGDTLTISGSRQMETLKENENYHRKERNGGKFSRTMQLPFKISEKKIEAHYEKGILKITLPREEAEKPRKIEIKVN